MTKELVTQETVTLPTELQGSWGAKVDNDDIIISRIHVPNQMSEAVKSEKCKAGDIVDSSTHEIYALRGDTLEFVPVHVEKKWRVERKEKNAWQFSRYEDFNFKNAHLPYEYTEGSDHFRRIKIMSFYVLLPVEIDAQLAGHGAALPHILSFQNSSYETGKKITTEIAKSAFANLPPAAKTFMLSTKKMSNDLGEWWIPDVVGNKPSKVEYVKAAKEWSEILKQTKVKTAEEAL